MVVQIAKNFSAMLNCEDSVKMTCNVQAEDLKIFKEIEKIERLVV